MTLTRWWLIAGVLLAPLAVTPFGQAQDVMQAKNNAFLHLGLLGSVVFVRSWWGRAILVWSWASFLISGMHGWAFLGLLGVVVWCVLCEASSRLSEGDWRNLRRAIAGAAGIQIGWMAVQLADADPIFVSVQQWGQGAAQPNPALRVPPQGWFTNPMDAALFLGLTLPAVGTIHWLAAVVVSIAALMQGSTVGLVLVVLYWLWRLMQWDRWTALTGAVVAAPVLALGWWMIVDPQGWGHKPALWVAAVDLIRMHPIVGWGLNALDFRVILTTTGGQWNFLFNEWIQWTLETGLIGLGLVLGAVLFRLGPACYRIGLRSECVAAAGMLLAVSCFSIPFRIGPVALMASLYLGQLMRSE